MNDELETLQEILEEEKQRIWPDSLEYTVIADKRIKALTAGVEALQKQIPKAPQYKRVYGKRWTGEEWCVECGSTVFRNDDYCTCTDCGQRIKLDWSEVKDDAINDAENPREKVKGISIHEYFDSGCVHHTVNICPICRHVLLEKYPLCSYCGSEIKWTDVTE